MRTASATRLDSLESRPAAQDEQVAITARLMLAAGDKGNRKVLLAGQHQQAQLIAVS